MNETRFSLAVVMERTPTKSPWVSHQWAAHGLLPHLPENAAGTRTVVLDRPEAYRVLHPALTVALFKDEAEGYFLNVSSPSPCVFVCWRVDEESGDAVPHMLTLSYNEAARWMDAQEKVDRVSMPAEIFADVSAWVSENYAPPMKKQRLRPNSFKSKDGRYDGAIKGGATEQVVGEGGVRE